MNFFLTQDRMGLEIWKRYSYSFHPMSAKLYKDIGGIHGGIHTLTFLDNGPIKKKCCRTLKF